MKERRLERVGGALVPVWERGDNRDDRDPGAHDRNFGGFGESKTVGNLQYAKCNDREERLWCRTCAS